MLLKISYPWGNVLVYFGKVPLFVTLVCSFLVSIAAILTVRSSSWGLAKPKK
jgi:hypothetical protein